MDVGSVKQLHQLELPIRCQNLFNASSLHAQEAWVEESVLLEIEVLKLWIVLALPHLSCLWEGRE